MTNISRRTFIKTGAFTAAGLTIVPGHVLGRSFGFTAPSDKLNIAGIGVGGMGRRNLANMSTENIVALCDVDWHYADKTFKDYPNARRFKDWRVMFDEIGSSIDAVMVATPGPYTCRCDRPCNYAGQALLYPETAYTFCLRISSAYPSG